MILLRFHRDDASWNEYYPRVNSPTIYSNRQTQLSANGNIFVTLSTFSRISKAIDIESGNLLVTDSKFTSCSALNGGGIYITSNSGIFVRLNSNDCSCSGNVAFIYSKSSNFLGISNSITQANGNGFNGISINNGKQNLTTTNISKSYQLINSAYLFNQCDISHGNISLCTIIDNAATQRVSYLGYQQYRIKCTVYARNSGSDCIIFENSNAYFQIENSIIVENSAPLFSKSQSGNGGLIYNSYYSNPSISDYGCIISNELHETNTTSMFAKEFCQAAIFKPSTIETINLDDEIDLTINTLMLSFIYWT
ncbi:hypothetical protein TVAG_204250 [Trichomonas vaginalis G3]|uniref:Uncharacterized protein n=1 Tax=Trichomonas vaginalis (strain ATCC PRA-98 / G3) TaxID=412133 RepID=A2FJ19_TRIV3|nr:hypothetical protein TVAGG3_0879190 [Trichomonas vaginalis G3]EAX95083.1 hypothetical protein TVAG_204250 [Trichomonas vaginalis G3]KAI5501919.1 hypothetical protein TVAGG3_0879190 [Trichomonas vaginalis G3]|eukprot:XP_001308013.1 hypothetical protein [Trichomonas vaginalis G3]